MIKRVLTVAGSDSCGGAGIQADLKTFYAFGVYGMSVITAVTAQNSVKVHGIEGVSPEFIGLQFESVLTDFGIDGVKTGMLYNTEIVMVVANKFRENPIPYIVVDPVMVAKGGSSLLEGNAIKAVKNDLIPLATLVTPNIPEAEILSDSTINSIEDMKEAAIKIQAFGSMAVLVKGGHLTGKALDVLFDGEKLYTFSSERIETKNTHGTGCTYSAAILSNLVKGRTLTQSVQIAKSYVTEAIKNAFPLGKGYGPLNHFVRVKP